MKSSEGGTGQALRDIPTKETVQETIEQKEQKILIYARENHLDDLASFLESRIEIRKQIIIIQGKISNVTDEMQRLEKEIREIDKIPKGISNTSDRIAAALEANAGARTLREEKMPVLEHKLSELRLELEQKKDYVDLSRYNAL